MSLLPLNLYWPQARLYPALIAIAPLIALVLTMMPWNKLHPSQFAATVGIGVLVFALSEFSRRRGKRLEKDAVDIGPRHTSSMLWHKDTRLHPDRKDPILAFAAGKINQKRPTPGEESADAARADAFYERCAAFLREAMRAPKFQLLFNENVSYGYQRNLFALKPIGLVANGIAILVAGAIAYGQYRYQADFDPTPFLFVLVVGLVHAFALLTIVNRKAVVAASDSYARQFLSSAELLISGHPQEKEKKASSRRKTN